MTAAILPHLASEGRREREELFSPASLITWWDDNPEHNAQRCCPGSKPALPMQFSRGGNRCIKGNSFEERMEVCVWKGEGGMWSAQWIFLFQIIKREEMSFSDIHFNTTVTLLSISYMQTGPWQFSSQCHCCPRLSSALPFLWYMYLDAMYSTA